MLRVIPGNTITSAFGIETGMLTEEQLADLRVYYGIDKPLLEQYLSWITSFLRGNLGYSYSTGVPISKLTASALPVTIELAIIGTILGVIMGIAVGMFSAKKPGSSRDFAGH